MDKEKLNTVYSYISSSLEGQDAENPKIDFKRLWYKLNEDPGRYQFLKDTSAIANTIGLDGYIIIGFDEKTKEFFDTTFKDCGLSDSEQLPGIINSHVDRIYDLNHYDIEFDGHKLSVLHIPPSLDKPHVIRCYKSFSKDGKETKADLQRTFVKKSTSTAFASKNDLELMYYDRKNIIPEYKIITNIHYPSISYGYIKFYSGMDELSNYKFTVILTFENNGRRPVAIISLSLILTEYTNPSENEFLTLDSTVIYKQAPLVIHPNEIVTKSIEFECKELFHIELTAGTYLTNKIINQKRHLATKFITLELANKEILKSELVKI